MEAKREHRVATGRELLRLVAAGWEYRRSGNQSWRRVTKDGLTVDESGEPVMDLGVQADSAYQLRAPAEAAPEEPERKVVSGAEAREMRDVALRRDSHITMASWFVWNGRACLSASGGTCNVGPVGHWSFETADPQDVGFARCEDCGEWLAEAAPHKHECPTPCDAEPDRPDIGPVPKGCGVVWLEDALKDRERFLDYQIDGRSVSLTDICSMRSFLEFRWALPDGDWIAKRHLTVWWCAHYQAAWSFRPACDEHPHADCRWLDPDAVILREADDADA